MVNAILKKTKTKLLYILYMNEILETFILYMLHMIPTLLCNLC